VSSEDALSELANLAVKFGVWGADETPTGLLEFAYRLMAHVAKERGLAQAPSLLLAMTAMRLLAIEEGYRRGDLELHTALGLGEPPGKRARDVATKGFDVYCDVEELRLQDKDVLVAIASVAPRYAVSPATLKDWYYDYIRGCGLGRAVGIVRGRDGVALLAWVTPPVSLFSRDF
jgi:hypothetical protein